MYKISFVLLFFTFFSCSEVKNTIKKSENSKIQSTVIQKIQKRTEKEILVCAHRAYHKFAPENSLESIKKAIEAKIDIVEIDVNTTKDGVLVLMHDNKIDRTTNGTGYIRDFTFAELSNLFLVMNDSVTTHKIPTLQEVLEISKNKIILNLDIKNVEISKLYQQLKENNMQNDVFSFIWDRKKIAEILAIDSTYAVLPLVSNSKEMMYYAKIITSKLQHFDEKSLNLENMTWAKKNAIQVFMNSLWHVDKLFEKNNTASMDKIIELRPAIIQTDHPVLLLKYLKNKKLHR